jgi:hypothetical protein
VLVANERVPPVASTEAESAGEVVVEAVVGEDDDEDVAAEDAAAEDVAAEDVAAEDVAAEDVAAEDVAAEDVGSVLDGVSVSELVTPGGLVTAELALGADDATPRPDSRITAAVTANAILSSTLPNRARISFRPRALHSLSVRRSFLAQDARSVWAQDLPVAIGTTAPPS